MKRIFFTLLFSFILGVVHAANVTMTVDNTKYQYVRGFGAFVCNPQFSYNHMSESEINLVWGPNSTLKCNIMRLYLPIGESNFSQSLSTAKIAKNLGLYLFATPWSMPAEWKTYDTVNAMTSSGDYNYLNEAYYETYADYLNSYVTYLKNNNVNLDAISIQNEPDWPCEYAGCIFTTTQIVNFLANYASRIDCKVIAPETIGMTDSYANALYNSSAALANFEIYGGHQYSGVGTAFQKLAEKNKELWMTEYLINWATGDNKEDRDVDWSSDAFNYATAINTCMLSNVNAWVNYAAKRFYSIMGDGTRGTTTGEITKRGYVMGNFSKYITGSTRLGSSFSSNDLSGSAYLSQTEDTIFAVIINSSSASHQLTLALPFYAGGGKSSVTSSSKNLLESNIEFNAATNRPAVTIEASSVTTLLFVNSEATKVADFDYDLASGRYIVNPDELDVEGDLQFDSSTGVLTLPAGKSGKLTLTFNGVDFSNVSKVKMSREGDDLFSTLTITNSEGSSVNTSGGAFYSSRYDLNYADYQTNSSSVNTLVWEGSNQDTDDKTMTLRQILILVDVMRADELHEVPLYKEEFGIWNGTGTDAERTSDDNAMQYNIDQYLAGQATVYGNGNVKALNYADLTPYSVLRIYGDDGMRIRALFNRSTDTSSDFVEKAGYITDGVFEVNLKSVGDYVHLNAIKVGNGDNGSVWRIRLVDDNTPMDYRIYGKQYVATNLATALNDMDATNYDATELSNTSEVSLTTANKNALVYVTDASKLSNTYNVVVKNDDTYSASSIVLTDPSTALGDRPSAYFPNGSVVIGDASWEAAAGGAYVYHWDAATSSEIQIFNNIIDRQEYKRLAVVTSSFTNTWGIRFYDTDDNLITEQGYWRSQEAGNLIKEINIDSLFAAKGVSDKRSDLAKVRLYNISSDEGEVVLTSAYLFNKVSDINYPFFAPYDISAANASLTTYIPASNYTTLCIPFSTAVPDGVSAFNLTVNGATSAAQLVANRPVLVTGTGNVQFAQTEAEIKATDNLENQLMKGVYSSTTAPEGSYVENIVSSTAGFFELSDKATFYEVPEENEYILYPFRAYATESVENPYPDYYDLTITDALVATMYLPYAVTIPEEDFLIPCYVNSVDVEQSEARFKRISGGVIPACEGVVIYGNQGTYRFYRTETEQSFDSNCLKGVTVDTPVKDLYDLDDLVSGRVRVYTFQRGISKDAPIQFYKKGINTSVTANKAYLPVWDEYGVVKEMRAVFDDVPTSIDFSLLSEPQDNIYYDLSGRIVRNPGKGIYIVNGKKVFIK